MGKDEDLLIALLVSWVYIDSILSDRRLGVGWEDDLCASLHERTGVQPSSQPGAGTGHLV